MAGRVVRFGENGMIVFVFFVFVIIIIFVRRTMRRESLNSDGRKLRLASMRLCHFEGAE